MAVSRNYKAEYQHRLERASARGLSRSQARGHARSGEAPLRNKPLSSDHKLEAALKLLLQIGRQGDAARQAGVAPERFRRFLRHNALAVRTGRHWHVTDDRPRRMRVITDGDWKDLTLAGFEQASFNGAHSSAVGAFLRSNDIDLLFPFIGRSVRDVRGRLHMLETNPNRLHRMAAQGDEPFHEIYRLIF